MAKTSTERTRQTRERQRRAGMRLLQEIWVPDTRSPAFARGSSATVQTDWRMGSFPCWSGHAGLDQLRNSVLKQRDAETG